MSKNGWLQKYQANRGRLNAPELDELAAQMEAGGFDANDEQWDQLNQAVDALPPEEQKQDEPTAESNARPQVGALGDGNAEDGVADNGRLVSKDQPGHGSNPIGYPGTDQDQEGPGKGPKTVPGMKPTEESKGGKK